LHEDKQKSDEKIGSYAIEKKIPTLAICYGLQLINVLSKGTLHQHLGDLPNIDPVHHASLGKYHNVKIEVNSKISEILKLTEARVNSWHHQGINKVGNKLKATALSEDGVIEAIEHDEHPFMVGVQWHPERMVNEAHQLELFKALINSSERA